MRATRRLARAILVTTCIVGTPAVGVAAAAPSTQPAPSAASAAPWEIRYGDHDWSVVCLQQGLNYYAYATRGQVLPAGTVDGVFGQRTLSAVRSLQVYRGRRVTGVVGRTTGEDLVQGLWYNQGAQGIKDWLVGCQHTIPRYGNYPVA